MPDFPVHVQFPGRLVFVGFGSIGQGVLPLVLRHIGIKPERITIVTATSRAKREAAEYGIKFVVNPLTRDNYRQVLEPLIGKGDFLLNLSVDVSSIALIKFAHERRRAVSRYVHRAVAGRLHRSVDFAGAAYQLRAARGSAGSAQVAPEWSDGSDHARCEPRHGFALRQTGVAEPGGRYRASTRAIRARASSGLRWRTSCK
jgi:hypothetical protein